MFAAAATVAVGASALPVAAKAIGELHRAVFMSNALARQGQSLVGSEGEIERSARQRAAGIGGAVPESDEPSYMDNVPKKAVAGDTRGKYVQTRGSATSSRGILSDILAKVPRRANGTDEYKEIARPRPSRQAGYDNQAFAP
jgi:hypothetical protein